MNWSNIRLELACGPQFPRGSPHRCYLLSLPLKTNGFIDETVVLASPKRATVRRFWPSQADLRGTVIKTPSGWAFSYESREQGEEDVLNFDTHPMRVGECFTLTEPDRKRLPFKVTNVESLP